MVEARAAHPFGGDDDTVAGIRRGRRFVVPLRSVPAPFLRLWAFLWSAMPQVMREG